MAFGVALAAHAIADPDFAVLRSYFVRLMTFDFSSAEAGLRLTGLGAAEICCWPTSR